MNTSFKCPRCGAQLLSASSGHLCPTCQIFKGFTERQLRSVPQWVKPLLRIVLPIMLLVLGGGLAWAMSFLDFQHPTTMVFVPIEALIVGVFSLFGCFCWNYFYQGYRVLNAAKPSPELHSWYPSVVLKVARGNLVAAPRTGAYVVIGVMVFGFGIAFTVAAFLPVVFRYLGVSLAIIGVLMALCGSRLSLNPKRKTYEYWRGVRPLARLRSGHFEDFSHLLLEATYHRGSDGGDSFYQWQIHLTWKNASLFPVLLASFDQRTADPSRLGEMSARELAECLSRALELPVQEKELSQTQPDAGGSVPPPMHQPVSLSAPASPREPLVITIPPVAGPDRPQAPPSTIKIFLTGGILILLTAFTLFHFFAGPQWSPIVRTAPAVPDTRIPVEAPTPLETIYAAIKVEDFRSDQTSYAARQIMTVQYKLANRSPNRLVIPVYPPSAPQRLVGTEQFWIERLEGDGEIPAMPTSVSRAGRRYAVGGGTISIERWLRKVTMDPGEAIPIQKSINLAGYPAGSYRLYLNYQRLEKQAILQSATYDFKVINNPAKK